MKPDMIKRASNEEGNHSARAGAKRPGGRVT